MTTHNDQAKTLFPLSLDGRGAGGEGVLRYAKLALAVLFLAAPNAALADDECGLQAGTTPVECDQSSYGSGVTYDAVGDLFIEFTNPTVSNIGGAGVTLSGDGSESINFDSATTATELDSAGATAALLGVTTVDGNIVIATEDMDADFAPTTHGIFAQSTGTGSIDITTTGTVDALSGTNPAGSIGIEAIANGGDITLTAEGPVLGNQHAIRAVAGGAGDLTITSLSRLDGGIDATAGTGSLTINVIGTPGGFLRFVEGGIRVDTGGNAAINIGPERRVAGGIQAMGAGTLVLNNNGTISSNTDFADLGGGYVFNNNAGALWESSGGVVSQLGAGELNNAGTIDIRRISFISAPGTTFTGSGASQLAMSAVLDGDGRMSCTDAIAQETFSSTTASAGCLDLSGGATSGQTSILIDVFNNPDPFAEPIDKPINAGIVLVDVSGGSSAADHFVLDPGSIKSTDFSNQVSIYAEDPVYGAVLDTGGLFDYALLYNPNTQQHILSSVPQAEGLQYAALIQESLSVWHTSSDAIAGRQADLRDGGKRGGWVRFINESTDRDFKPRVTTHGNTFDYEHSYSLDTQALIAGYDLTADDNHVFGVHLGFMDTKLEHDDSETVDETDFPSSVTFGTYMGWWNESGLTLDGTINVNLLDIEHNVSSEFEDTRSNVLTVGIRAEAGWRMPVSEAFYVQPLATLSYAMADIENLNMRDYDASFEDTSSARGALGVRFGGDTGLNVGQFDRIGYWLTARAWEETTEDGRVEFKTDGDPLAIEDDYSGSFEEVGLGVNLSDSEDKLSVYLSGGLKSGDLIDSNYNVSVGARLNW